MKKALPLSVLFVCVLLAVRSFAEDLPEYRPALPIRGQQSLINLINVDSLVKRGQGSATVMFSCGVSTLGYAGNGQCFRGTPNSEMLSKEIVRRIDRSQWVPAVFHHNKVGVWISGTATLVVKDGKPHLRIFLNQEEKDLLAGHDFVAPQFIFTAGISKLRYFEWPQNSSFHYGVASTNLDVDGTGQVTHSTVAYEYPEGMGFGAEVAGRVHEARFIPGFRDGKLQPCHFTWSLVFNSYGPQLKTG